MAGFDSSVGALNQGASDSSAVGEMGMNAIAAQNAESMQQIMLQGILSALRAFAEALAKTLKAGAEAVKNLV